jgi:hypothetical protein
MKAIQHISVLFLYLWVMVGISIGTHFCSGEPVSTRLLGGVEQPPACCCGDAEDMEGCCNTSVSTLRVDDAHTAVLDTFSPEFSVQFVPALTAPRVAAPAFVTPAEVVHPPGSTVPTHILDCSFLI